MQQSNLTDSNLPFQLDSPHAQQLNPDHNDITGY